MGFVLGAPSYVLLYGLSCGMLHVFLSTSTSRRFVLYEKKPEPGISDILNLRLT